MKIHWGLCTVVAVCGGIMLGSYLNLPEPQRILRGTQEHIVRYVSEQIPSKLTSIMPASIERLNEQLQRSAADWEFEDLPATAVSRNAELNAPFSETEPKLNLRLPEGWDQGEWKKPVLAAFPNFFKSNVPSSAFGVSTRLYWDESEEARLKPIEKTIEGAEVELHFKLP